jgi:murein DD-endopeptidase MepM/ murein hydrolase activator NlpD
MHTIFPLQKKVFLTNDSESFQERNFKLETELPLGSHVGAFGTFRKNHRHEGVDLYCLPGDNVVAMEAGTITKIEDFTGEKANSPWWHDTRAVHVEGKSGVIVYGELIEDENIQIGVHVQAGDVIGYITPVLKVDKGRPMTMLHLELYEQGSRESVVWEVDQDRPEKLLDPTNLLVKAMLKS